MGADFLSFPIHELIGKNLYAFPPNPIVLQYYNRLTEIATPWVLLCACFASEPLVVTEARRKKLRIFDLPKESVITPTKERSELGYWKTPDNISTIKVIANRL